MRLTLRFDVFLVSHSPTPTQNSIERSDQSVNRQVGLPRRVELEVRRLCHGEFPYGWGGRRQPASTSGDRFRHLRYMLTASQGFPLKTVAAGRRGRAGHRPGRHRVRG